MSSGNGYLANAVNADDEVSRLVLNAMLTEHGYGHFAATKEQWAERLRPSAAMVEAIRNLKRGDDE
jgi:hypothetical protein